jgi:hypothetical protein
MITELKQSTIQLCGGPRDGAIVKLKKSTTTPKHYDCLNERCYQSLFNDGYLHIYELRPVPTKKKNQKSDKIICRFYHVGLAEVTK